MRAGPLLALLLWLLPSMGEAHAPHLTVAWLALSGETARAEVTLGLQDLEAALGAAPTDAAIAAYVGARLELGPACIGSLSGAPVREADHVNLVFAWTCRAAPQFYRATLFHEVDPATRHIVMIRDGSGERQALLDPARPELLLGAPASPAAVAGEYLLLGIEHIFTGYDHVAFLLAVVLWSRRLLPVVKIVTAFTLAHSATLVAAALGYVAIPAEVIEPAIAASIVYVAAENFASREVDRRWRVTFLLGLVHGFGFAGVLGEMGLPPAATATALAAFNIGVEVGQVAIVGIVVPLLLAIDRATTRSERSRAVVYPASAAILALGLWWLVDRLPLA
jgi:hydrogenase/urease accessory protein HupE